MPKHQQYARKSLILDPIHPRDFRELSVIFACEQCSHFESEQKSCSIGYGAAKHMLEAQLRSYEVTGKVAFCRFSEID